MKSVSGDGDDNIFLFLPPHHIHPHHHRTSPPHSLDSATPARFNTDPEPPRLQVWSQHAPLERRACCVAYSRNIPPYRTGCVPLGRRTSIIFFRQKSLSMRIDGGGVDENICAALLCVFSRAVRVKQHLFSRPFMPQRGGWRTTKTVFLRRPPTGRKFSDFGLDLGRRIDLR